MPTFAYKCPGCGRQEEPFIPIEVWPHDPILCPSCHEWEMVRVIGVNVGIHTGEAGFKPHFNHSLGRFINSHDEAREITKRLSDEQNTQMTLVEEPFRVSDEGMDETRRANTDINKTREAKKYV